MKIYTILPLCIVLMFASGFVSGCRVCPRGWKKFESFCYYASSASMTWHQAQAHCKSIGGDLVKITSARENEFVLALVRDNVPASKQVWIGLKFISGDFYWSDYSVPVYKAWAPNEPNGRSREPCGIMWTGHTTHLPIRASGYWNDRICGVHSFFPTGLVCKKLC